MGCRPCGGLQKQAPTTPAQAARVQLKAAHRKFAGRFGGACATGMLRIIKFQLTCTVLRFNNIYYCYIIIMHADALEAHAACS